eukprot:5401121-Amphidinium_carterae.1
MSIMLYFAIFSNQFSGSLTSSRWLGLQLFCVSDNYLQGGLPEGALASTHLRDMFFARNLFAGTIPPCLGASRDTRIFDVTGMQHMGMVPATASRISQIQNFLLGHGLSGRMPQLHGTLHALSFWANEFGGRLREYCIDEGSLLLAHRNRLSCRIPSFAQVKPKLSLALIGNHLTQPASFPSWISREEQGTFFCVSNRDVRMFCLQGFSSACLFTGVVLYVLQAAKGFGHERHVVLRRSTWYQTIQSLRVLSVACFIVLLLYNTTLEGIACWHLSQRLRFQVAP